MISAYKEIVLEEKTNSPLFTKIYYKDVEENGYNLLIRPYNFLLPKDKEKDYFLLKEITHIFRGPFGSDLKKEEYVINGP